MKKLLLVSLVLLFAASSAYAEISAQTYSGNALQNYREQQVFTECYNGSGTDISSNFVVVLDTTATRVASGTTLGTYITTTTTAGNSLVLGVTDEVIPNGRVGRVCVRGPHKVYMTAAPSAAGATVATTTTAGAAIPWTAARPSNAAFGVALSATVITAPAGAVAEGYSSGEGPSNYWVYIGGVGCN
jgi:hypothetical protein